MALPSGVSQTLAKLSQLDWLAVNYRPFLQSEAGNAADVVATGQTSWAIVQSSEGPRQRAVS